jgi:uncharacterized membrane protein
MNDRITTTAHGDAPLSAAHTPDARVAALWATEADDQLIARTMTIARPIEEVLALLQRPDMLARAIDGGEPGGLVIEQTSGSIVTWHTPPQDEERHSGRIELRPAPAGRGTEITVTLTTEARGPLTRAMEKLTGKDPRIHARRTLRRFKQLLETGEMATSEPGRAAPRS